MSVVMTYRSRTAIGAGHRLRADFWKPHRMPAVAASGLPSPVQFALDLSKHFHEAWQLLDRGREPPLTCADSAVHPAEMLCDDLCERPR